MPTLSHETQIKLFEKQLNKKDDKTENTESNEQTITINSKLIKHILILSISKNIDLIFDKVKGKLLYITYNKAPHIISYNDNDKSILNVPIPDEIKKLNRYDIVSKSTTLIGTIISVKPNKLSECEEEPTALSFILFEKIDDCDNFDIKLIPNLQFNGMYIKESNFIDVVFSNINTFWIIIKDDNELEHLIYYYKPLDTILDLKKLNYNYLYDSISITDYKIICSMWTFYDITPSVIYLIVHDANYNITILQYTVLNIDSIIPNIPFLPKIVLYTKDKRLSGCGKYLSYCVNYNISMFSLLLEVDNGFKTYYTGILSFVNGLKQVKSQLTLELSSSFYTFPKEITVGEAQFMIFSIMEKTEKSIKLQNIEEYKQDIEKQKQITYIKQKKEDDKKKEEELIKQKARDAELIAESLIKEEEAEAELKKQKNKKQKQIQTKHNTQIQVKNKRLEKERLDKERLEKERLEKERLEKERLEKELLEKERLEKERLEKERLDKERLEKEGVLEAKLLEKARLEKARLDKERLEKERVLEAKLLEKERLEIARLEKERVLEAKLLEKERFENARLEKEQLEKERLLEETRLEKERLLHQNKLLEEALLKNEQNKNAMSNYHISNSIEKQNASHTLFYSFIYHLSMIDSKLAHEITNLPVESNYMEVMYKHRNTVMYALDMLVINNIHILSIKHKMYKTKLNDYTISAIYGSVLPVVYSLILNEIGYYYMPFNKYSEPLKMIDFDTMVIKLLDDFVETHTQSEYIKEQSVIIDYYTDENPITRTKVQTSSIHNLLCNCWDLNYTSAILIYEDEKEPYIIRHPDFTEFIFGTQPIQLLFGKNEKTLYNYNITMNRLVKTQTKWY